MLRYRRGLRRRGIETLEILLAVPILLVATLSAIELGMLVLVQQAVATAALEGARAAARVDATTDSVAQEVAKFLAVHDIHLASTGGSSVDGAWVLVETGNPGIVIAGQRGNANLAVTPQGVTPDTSQVRVTVSIQLNGGDGTPVPDWLNSFGFSLADRTLQVSAVAELE